MPLPQGPEKNAEHPLLNEIEDASAKMTAEEKDKVGE
jgi:hypothetical protein